jgi:hypothetical protein
VPGQHALDRAVGGLHGRVGERPFRKHRRVARGQEHGVALAQRHVQPFGQPQQHVAAGLGAAGLQEAQMARGNLGFAGQIELAHPAALPPLPQQIANTDGGGMGLRLHERHDSAAAGARTLPRK